MKPYLWFDSLIARNNLPDQFCVNNYLIPKISNNNYFIWIPKVNKFVKYVYLFQTRLVFFYDQRVSECDFSTTYTPSLKISFRDNTQPPVRSLTVMRTKLQLTSVQNLYVHINIFDSLDVM